MLFATVIALAAVLAWAALAWWAMVHPTRQVLRHPRRRDCYPTLVAPHRPPRHRGTKVKAKVGP